VQRMGPPHWGRFPPGRAYGELAGNDPLVRREITRLGARLMAHDLASLGINVDCVPVLDVPDPSGHEIIGDRAYGQTPDVVALLGRAAAEGLIAGGVLPVIKHIPGHGRAMADSHLELPVVDASFEELDARDFPPFRVLSDMPMAMTAHVIYAAIDRKRPATTSKTVMRQVIRGAIGFDGLVMSDDLSMKALSGDFTERAADSRAAGCDVVLHCNGDMAEMKAVVKGAGELKGRAAARARAALARLARVPEPFDAAEGRARFDAAFQGKFAA
jgi:beta-N-acetylhexosaminidase